MARTLGITLNSWQSSNKRFCREQRILSSGIFLRGLRSREKIQSGHILLQMIPNVTGRARLGINAAKRYIKHSVDRNRFKRITREVFRQHSITLLPVDIFISLRSAIVCPMDKQWNKALREELLKLLSMATHRIAK